MENRTCAVTGCLRAGGGDGVCAPHRYYRNQHGRLPAKAQIKDERERVLAKVDRGGDGCWLWNACLSTDGYGRVYFRQTYWQAHRAVWTLLRGEIPEGMELDHLCYTPRCCRPDHLEPVPPSVNRARVRAAKRPWMRDLPQNQPRESCKRGHPLTDETTRRVGTGRGRMCKLCDKITQTERRRARRAG